MTIRHQQFRMILESYQTPHGIARELNMRDATLPMLVGMMPTMSAGHVAEVVLMLLKVRTKQKRKFAVTVVDGLVYLENPALAMPATIAMVADRRADMYELADCIQQVADEQIAAQRRWGRNGH